MIYSYPNLFIVFKIIPLIIIITIVFKSKISSKIFSFYVSVLMFGVGIFQNMAFTKEYGFAVLIGNIILICLVGIVWLWEFIIDENNFSLKNISKWKLIFIPLTILAYWYPVSSEIGPNFTIQALFTNEAGLTYCMMTPVILTVLILYFPRVNLFTFRVTSFVAFLIAIMNMITWFGMNLDMWWMGIVHIPLLVTSFAGLLFGRKKKTKSILNK